MHIQKLIHIIFSFQLLMLSSIITLNAQSFDVISASDLSGAKWIGSEDQKFTADSLLFGDNAAPLFRKEFHIGKKLKTASLAITAAGYYLTSINGRKLENNVLDPAWTNFAKRIYFTTYDVTSMLRSGNNVIGIKLGNGFYNSLPLKMFGSFNLRQYLVTGHPQFITKLRLTYLDGTTEDIFSDTSWKTGNGPIIRNNVYIGEKYDANKEVPGWDLPNFKEEQWMNAELKHGPGGVLQPTFFPGVKITNSIRPVKIQKSGKTIIVDMGVNFTGLYKIQMKGRRGDTIKFRFGERLYNDGSLNPMTTVAGQIKRKGSGGAGSPAIAWQTDSYIFGTKEKVDFQPHFTFHAFRYIEIVGLNYVPSKDDVEGTEFHTNVENQNHFTCSSDLLNNIQIICRQTFLNNLISVQSDCPAREKFGYGGDLNATSETFIYNFDMQAFYRKTVYDWIDAMQDSVFIDTAPYVGIKYCGISWESAFLTTQDKLLQYYGDTMIINELYQKDLDWMSKVSRLHPDGIVDKGLSDHEVIGKVPVQLIGTTHYLECARIMKRFAEFQHDSTNIVRFKALENSLSRKLLHLYWYQPVMDPVNRQTLFATLIYYQLIPTKDLPAAADSLLKAVRNSPEGHFTTGIFGTKYILEALSMTGHTDEVFRIVNSTAFPGWGYMIDRGATTLWETWKESDNTYSNCHPMFGTVSEWYYRWLAGIRPLKEFDGFKKFLLAPTFLDGLNFVDAVYQSSSGDIKVAWKRRLNEKINMKVTIPKGISAQFLPVWKAQKIWKVTNVLTKKSFLFDSDKSTVELPEGEYEIN